MTDPGYGFVGLPPDVRCIAREEARWDRRVRGTLAGRIDIELTAEQPIHVGSGSKEAQQRSVVSRGARVRGAPGIPGSSLKGVLRARYEAITRSCAPLAPRAGTYDIRSSTGIEGARLLPSALRVAALEANCTRERPCPACALFGRMSLRSRITLTDLACVGGAKLEIALMPERFGPNLHHVGPPRKDPTGHVFEVRSLHGRKFGLGRGPAADNRQRVEVIPAGAVLAGQIRVFNATPAELGGLLAALGCDPASALKLGGGKAHGFGRAHCRVHCHLAGDSAAPLDPAEWRQRFVDSPDRWPDGERQLVALHGGEC
ncbi:MAG TPA: RAMP superfamily CRISPR-associated protein [Kofleriaceae bacterium]